MSKLKKREKSNWKATGSNEAGRLSNENPSGIFVTPMGMPINVITMMV